MDLIRLLCSLEEFLYELDLVAYLDKRLQGRDESVLIAATLAARLGLERVWAVDDHTADSSTPKALEKAWGEAIMKAWDNPYTKARADADAALAANLGKPGAMSEARRERIPTLLNQSVRKGNIVSPPFRM